MARNSDIKRIHDVMLQVTNITFNEDGKSTLNIDNDNSIDDMK